ncbi:hypothetical protein [Paucibacter soli]
MNAPDKVPAQAPSELVLDFDSDEPLPVCPMRKDGMGAGEICEACQ